MNPIKRIHILHTNDLHSHLHRAPLIRRLARELRNRWEERGETGILVDIGDHMDRVRMETEGTDGSVNLAVMEQTGYELFTFGNNELLTFSRKQLHDLFSRSSVEVVSSNVTAMNPEQTPEWVRTSKILDLGGVRVAFLGATIPYPHTYEMMGWRVSSPVEALAGELMRIREQADVTVLLSHLGLPHDRELSVRLAGLDVIIGAHTHHLLEKPERIKDTWIAAAGKYGMHLGHLVLEVDAKTGKLTGVQGTCHPLDQTGGDEEISRLIGEYRHEAAGRLSSVVADLPEPLEVDWREETPFPNLLADALLDWTGADLALVNNGVLLHSLQAGPVTRGDLHRACPHPINPALVRVRMSHVRRALEESLLDEFKDMPLRGFGFRGRVLGTLAVAGMEVIVDPRAKPYARVTEMRSGDRALSEDEEVKLATLDVFTFGAGYGSLKEGELIRYFLPEFLRDVLAARLAKPNATDKAKIRRWKQRDVLDRPD
ncbi:bifunctional metallophosphatase/5'-nucleotidase [Staphylospora marina]|uniref:bifunctional metallophosphatase/5'-nucleotidase n=1 Tax=Staphylospora marina TaxID=2490858 RepID=UPI0013DE25B9|nr:bifunctional UDP-sugar hydrolase/5'-nucleotidase [Staphylospora marina]